MIPESTIGRLQVLNVSDGDTEFSFNPQNEAECQRACKVVTDMLKAGYLIFVKLGDGTLRRVKRFDSLQRTYVIEDPPAQEATDDQAETAETAAVETPATTPPRRRGRPRKIAAGSVRTIAVARTVIREVGQQEILQDVLREIDEYNSVRLRVRPFFRWYDLWVGIYIDRRQRCLYVCPFFCVGLKIGWF